MTSEEGTTTLQDETLVPGVELLESMRSVGYSFSAAAADIIDNSIAAHATEVRVFADTVSGEYVAFLDDGCGMSAGDAREALKLAGTRNNTRGSSDLGRFGLGLKTASLSQGRKVTVLTKQGDEVTGLQWDLDHVLESGSWSIRVLESDDLTRVPQADTLLGAQHGTLVVWETLDYMLSGASNVADLMSSLLNELRKHLGLVFHRFIARSTDLRLYVNGVRIVAIDPFLESNPRTQVAPVENVVIDEECVRVEAFTLPHPSNFGVHERKRDDLGARMREAQGFYVYRNRRLISAGGWFGLAKQEELSKQTRVRVDIPVELDKHWQLDIKKSRVEPPQAFKQRFRQIVDRVKVPSSRVHRFRGRKESVAEFTFFWRLIEDREGFRYEVNAHHPAVMALRDSLPVEAKSHLDGLLFDLAQAYPSADLYMRLAENRQRVNAAYSDNGIMQRLRAVRRVGLPEVDLEKISEALAKIEPFQDVSNLGELIREVWKEAE